MYLVELGSTLKKYPPELQKKEYEVPGCTSLVYIHARLENKQVLYQGYAASKVVKGYLKILIDALSKKSPQEIVADNSINQFIIDAKMDVSTQSSRANAFSSVYEFMKKQAVLLDET